MRLVNRLLGRSTFEDRQMNLRLQTVRFRKLLENARALMELIADGRQKREEEYIFDRRYVTSLVELTLERASAMVYDACVLAHEGGEVLYGTLERLIQQARGRSLSEEDAGRRAGDEPEQLLAEALAWLEGAPGEAAASGPTVMSLVCDVLEHAIRGSIGATRLPARGLATLRWRRGGGRHEVALLDTARGDADRSGEVPALADVGCHPLSLLLAKAPDEDPAAPAAGQAAARRWFAATGPRDVSLRELGDGEGLWLEASLRGNRDSDFIFLRGDRAVVTKAVLGADFRLEPVGRHVLAWRYGASTSDLENDLDRLGEALIGRAEAGAARTA